MCKTGMTLSNIKIYNVNNDLLQVFYHVLNVIERKEKDKEFSLHPSVQTMKLMFGVLYCFVVNDVSSLIIIVCLFSLFLFIISLSIVGIIPKLFVDTVCFFSHNDIFFSFNNWRTLVQLSSFP